MYEVVIIKEGYSHALDKGSMKAGGTITLLKGPHNILVDTGSPWDKDLLLNELYRYNLAPKDIAFSVCTSGTPDRIGNLNLFPEATHVISTSVCKQGSYFLHAFMEENGLSPSQIHYFVGSHGHSDLIGLKENGLSSSQIHYVVGSHGHSDHIGNLNLFQSSVHIVSYDICKGDEFIMHDFAQGIPYEIDEFVEIWPTPGHTGSDVSVIVRGTQLGTVAVTGDLFEKYEDLDDPDIWQSSSERPELQEQSRIEVLKTADFIVPGHGPMFQVPPEYRKQMRVIMMHQEKLVEFTSSSGLASSLHSECVIVESD